MQFGDLSGIHNRDETIGFLSPAEKSEIFGLGST
jgi:hypothetical protein